MELRRRLYLSGEDVTTGLFGHWKMGSLVDEMGNNNLVKINNPLLTTGVDGIVDNAYTSAVNTTGYFNTAYNFYLDTDFTVSIWFKITGTPSTYRLPFIFRSSSAYVWGVEILGQRASQLPVEDAIGPLLNDGLWHNLTYVTRVSDGYIDKYLDGAWIGNKAQGAISPTTLCYLGLLASPNGAYNLIGALDNVRYYKRKLTAGQIKYLYDNKL